MNERDSHARSLSLMASTGRKSLLGFLLLGALAVASHAAEVFDFETLRYKAKMLAESPYVERKTRVPDALARLSYDDARQIRFRPDETRWRRDRLPFQLQFFHPGAANDRTVQLSEVSGRRAEPIPFSRDLFDYGPLDIGSLPASTGFSGFRILYPLNKPGDEVGAFQGASYFRFLCQKVVYGLSARGLALGTGEAGGEEFPIFEEFWLQRPKAEAKDMTVYALLDSPSVAGAYRFVITPGAETITRVRAALYFRNNAKTVGIAPLTSMFWHGENSTEQTFDLRPEVHDSDGLMIHAGSGEWLWRPLTNPKGVLIQTFTDENPHGFGLLQRDRDFASYDDLEANYHMRPSVWVEPVGQWGRGAVRLVELPTANEFLDNMVAFWTPEQLPAPGEAVELEYKLHWFTDQIRPPAGYVASTRRGRASNDGAGIEHFTIEFDGPYLSKQGPDPTIEPDISVGEGATLVNQNIQKNPYNNRWRVTFAIKADGSGKSVNLRCYLRKPPHVLTETWSYLWQP